MWHGTPDTRVRGNEVVYRQESNPLSLNDEERMTSMEKVLGLVYSSSGTDGVTVTVEAKVYI